MRDIDLYHKLELDKPFVFNNKSITLRDYQIEAIIKLLAQYSNDENGGVWHCSGSGNTVTSYRLAQLFNKFENIDKVIFLTTKDEKVFLDFKNLAKTNKQLLSMLNTEDFIVSYASLIPYGLRYMKEEYEMFKDMNIVFIIDSDDTFLCSRRFLDAVSFFSNSKFYYFVSHPTVGYYNLFDGFTNTYLLNQALSDKIITPIKFEFLDNDNLNNVFNCGKYLTSPKRISQISKWIIENNNRLTVDNKFQAVLIVPTSSSILKYYDFLKTGTDLKIAAVFDFSDKLKIMEKETIKNHASNIISDYNRTFNTNYNVKGAKFRKYKEDVFKRFEDGEIDLLITTESIKFKPNAHNINTLYVDLDYVYNELKSLSFVNKPKDGKNFGNIIYFTNISEKLNTLLGNACDESFDFNLGFNSYNDFVSIFNKELSDFYKIVKTPEDVLNIDSINQLKIISHYLDNFKIYLKFLYTFIDKNPKEDVNFSYNMLHKYNEAFQRAESNFNWLNYKLKQYDSNILGSISSCEDISDYRDNINEITYICPICHAIGRHRGKCENCGIDLVNLDKFLSHNMDFSKICENCNIVYNIGSKYCYKCGEKLTFSDEILMKKQPYKCINCGFTTSNENYIYCIKCGSKL